MKYLFVAMPTNSGSGLLTEYLGKCENAIPLKGFPEASWVMGDAAPFPPIEIYVRYRRTYSFLQQWYDDPANWNWPLAKERLHESWKSSKPQQYGNENSVLLMKSTQSVFYVPQLAREFPEAKFILGIRDPYALCEGIHRKEGHDLSQCAIHWKSLAMVTRQNLEELGDRAILVRYKDVCDQPREVERRVREFVPEFHDFCLDGSVAKPSLLGEQTTGLSNLNELHTQRLQPVDFSRINSVLKDHLDLLDWYGYTLLGPV